MDLLMDDPKYPRIADDDDHTGNQECDDEHRGFTAAAILVVENGTGFQLRIVSKLA